MSGRRKFSELTELFTPEDRKIVEEKKAKMRASLKRPSKPSESPMRKQPLPNASAKIACSKR